MNTYLYAGAHSKVFLSAYQSENVSKCVRKVFKHAFSEVIKIYVFLRQVISELFP